MKTYLFLLIGLFLLSVTACKKDDKPASTTNTATGPKLLRQYKMLTDGDTTLKFSYTYDNNNRISTSHVMAYESGILSGEETFTFTYDTNDSLPSRVNIVYFDAVIDSTDTSDEYFFYNAARILTKDSLHTDGGGDGAYNYNYYADHITLTTSFYDTVINHLDKVNGNIISETDTVSGRYILSFIYNAQVSYDDHPNPFYKTGIKRVFFTMPENYNDDGIPPAVKNNITEFSYADDDIPTPHNGHQRYTYTYDSDGYPITQSGTDLISGSTLKGFYYY